MSRREMEGYAAAEIEMIVGESCPFEFLEIQVVGQIYAEISLRSHGPAGVFEFFFVHVDGYVGPEEVFESARVVKVQVAHDNSLDVLNVVSRGIDCGG